ncbi:MAG: BamA/TamA family outer membrane protein [Bacteroidota bacterium]|nr:BamA/TamA family outer membrane protein [Bacteroidota bacterium]
MDDEIGMIRTTAVVKVKTRFKNTIIFKNVFFLAFVVLVFSSCSNTRYLAEGEVLYTGAEVKINSLDEISQEAELITEMQEVIRPEPNKTVFGILRPRLSIYNWAGQPKKEKGVRYWIKNEFGEAPVLLSQVPLELNNKLLKNRLENFGHFTPQVSYDIIEKNKKATIEYVATIQKPYLIKSISFPTGPSELELQIRKSSINSLLQINEPYNLEKLIAERVRIDSTLKNLGYFYFNPDYLIFKIDSTRGSREVNVFLSIKEDMPLNAKVPYIIEKVIINTNYSLDEQQLGISKADTIRVNGLYILDENVDFKPEVFKRTVFLRNGNRYSRRDHQVTLNHLMGLGTFQFVNIRFIDLQIEGDTGKLNAYINLTPLLKRTVRLELRGVSKSNNFAGPGVSANYRNRNLFRGAELFIVNLNANYETLIGGRQRGLNSYEFGINTELQVPRFIAPFNLNPDRPISFIPKTRVVLGYQMLNRVQFFWLNSFNASFGYLWSESRVKIHEFNPISLNYVRLGNESEQFRRILSDNPILRRSFENQLIFGSVYTFTYNDLIEEQKKHNYFFRGTIDLAGNTMHLSQLTYRENPTTEEQPYLVLGIPYAQYARGEIDFRYYFRPTTLSRIATRFITGVGYAYGNATTLPYVKQFFIGGSNSIRAFLPRSLGPGTYRTSRFDTTNGSEGPVFFLDQTGDIRLEGNLEYRFPIIAMLKGAVFLDAGNIWTFRENPGTPGGQFNINRFHTEIAVGTGFGLRLDVDFFVLRFDMGIPLREPFQPQGERWVINAIDFGSPEWRGQRLVLNIAIGYPF